MSCQEVSFLKNLPLNFNATLTRAIRMGTSRSGPITVAKAWFEAIPKIATATAIANSKSLLAAVVSLPAGEKPVRSARLLADGSLGKFESGSLGIIFSVPPEKRGPCDTVVVLEF